MKFKIFTDKPLPPLKRKLTPRYPFEELEIGHSFLVPIEFSKNDTERRRQLRKWRSSINHSLRMFNKRAEREHSLKITTRQIDEGLMVWRIK